MNYSDSSEQLIDGSPEEELNDKEENQPESRFSGRNDSPTGISKSNKSLHSYENPSEFSGRRRSQSNKSQKTGPYGSKTNPYTASSSRKKTDSRGRTRIVSFNSSVKIKKTDASEQLSEPLAGSEPSFDEQTTRTNRSQSRLTNEKMRNPGEGQDEHEVGGVEDTERENDMVNWSSENNGTTNRMASQSYRGNEPTNRMTYEGYQGNGSTAKMTSKGYRGDGASNLLPPKSSLEESADLLPSKASTDKESTNLTNSQSGQTNDTTNTSSTSTSSGSTSRYSEGSSSSSRKKDSQYSNEMAPDTSQKPRYSENKVDDTERYNERLQTSPNGVSRTAYKSASQTSSQVLAMQRSGIDTPGDETRPAYLEQSYTVPSAAGTKTTLEASQAGKSKLRSDRKLWEQMSDNEISGEASMTAVAKSEDTARTIQTIGGYDKRSSKKASLDSKYNQSRYTERSLVQWASSTYSTLAEENASLDTNTRSLVKLEDEINRESTPRTNTGDMVSAKSNSVPQVSEDELSGTERGSNYISSVYNELVEDAPRDVDEAYGEDLEDGTVGSTSLYRDSDDDDDLEKSNFSESSSEYETFYNDGTNSEDSQTTPTPTTRRKSLEKTVNRETLGTQTEKSYKESRRSQHLKDKQDERMCPWSPDNEQTARYLRNSSQQCECCGAEQRSRASFDSDRRADKERTLGKREKESFSRDYKDDRCGSSLYYKNTKTGSQGDADDESSECCVAIPETAEEAVKCVSRLSELELERLSELLPQKAEEKFVKAAKELEPEKIKLLLKNCLKWKPPSKDELKLECQKLREEHKKEVFVAMNYELDKKDVALALARLGYKEQHYAIEKAEVIPIPVENIIRSTSSLDYEILAQLLDHMSIEAVLKWILSASVPKRLKFLKALQTCTCGANGRGDRCECMKSASNLLQPDMHFQYSASYDGDEQNFQQLERASDTSTGVDTSRSGFSTLELQAAYLARSHLANPCETEKKGSATNRTTEDDNTQYFVQYNPDTIGRTLSNDPREDQKSRYFWEEREVFRTCGSCYCMEVGKCYCNQQNTRQTQSHPSGSVASMQKSNSKSTQSGSTCRCKSPQCRCRSPDMTKTTGNPLYAESSCHCKSSQRRSRSPDMTRTSGAPLYAESLCHSKFTQCRCGNSDLARTHGCCKCKKSNNLNPQPLNNEYATQEDQIPKICLCQRDTKKTQPIKLSYKNTYGMLESQQTLDENEYRPKSRDSQQGTNTVRGSSTIGSQTGNQKVKTTKSRSIKTLQRERGISLGQEPTKESSKNDSLREVSRVTTTKGKSAQSTRNVRFKTDDTTRESQIDSSISKQAGRNAGSTAIEPLISNKSETPGNVSKTRPSTIDEVSEDADNGQDGTHYNSTTFTVDSSELPSDPYKPLSSDYYSSLFSDDNYESIGTESRTKEARTSTPRDSTTSRFSSKLKSKQSTNPSTAWGNTKSIQRRNLSEPKDTTRQLSQTSTGRINGTSTFKVAPTDTRQSSEVKKTSGLTYSHKSSSTSSRSSVSTDYETQSEPNELPEDRPQSQKSMTNTERRIQNLENGSEALSEKNDLGSGQRQISSNAWGGMSNLNSQSEISETNTTGKETIQKSLPGDTWRGATSDNVSQNQNEPGSGQRQISSNAWGGMSNFNSQSEITEKNTTGKETIQKSLPGDTWRGATSDNVSQNQNEPDSGQRQISSNAWGGMSNPNSQSETSGNYATQNSHPSEAWGNQRVNTGESPVDEKQTEKTYSSSKLFATSSSSPNQSDQVYSQKSESYGYRTSTKQSNSSGRQSQKVVSASAWGNTSNKSDTIVDTTRQTESRSSKQNESKPLKHSKKPRKTLCSIN